MIPVFEVSDAEIAFPVAKNLPPMEQIPKEFHGDRTKWHKLFDKWFYSGANDVTFYPKEGVDPKKAIRAIRSIIGSYGPKHEHKKAGVSYLLSEWFHNWEVVIETEGKTV